MGCDASKDIHQLERASPRLQLRALEAAMACEAPAAAAPAGIDEGVLRELRARVAEYDAAMAECEQLRGALVGQTARRKAADTRAREADRWRELLAMASCDEHAEGRAVDRVAIAALRARVAELEAEVREADASHQLLSELAVQKDTQRGALQRQCWALQERVDMAAREAEERAEEWAAERGALRAELDAARAAAAAPSVTLVAEAAAAAQPSSSPSPSPAATDPRQRAEVAHALAKLEVVHRGLTAYAAQFAAEQAAHQQLQGAHADLEARHAAMAGDVARLTASEQTLEGSLNGLRAAHAALETACTAAKADLAEVEEECDAANLRCEALESQNLVLSTEKQRLEADVAAANATCKEVVSELGEVKLARQALEERVGKLEGELAETSDICDMLEREVDRAAEKLEEQKRASDALAKEHDAVRGALEADVARVTAAHAVLEAADAEHADARDALEAEVARLSEEHTAQAAEVRGLEAAVADKQRACDAVAGELEAQRVAFQGDVARLTADAVRQGEAHEAALAAGAAKYEAEKTALEETVAQLRGEVAALRDAEAARHADLATVEARYVEQLRAATASNESLQRDLDEAEQRCSRHEAEYDELVEQFESWRSCVDGIDTLLQKTHSPRVDGDDGGGNSGEGPNDGGPPTQRHVPRGEDGHGAEDRPRGYSVATNGSLVIPKIAIRTAERQSTSNSSLVQEATSLETSFAASPPSAREGDASEGLLDHTNTLLLSALDAAKASLSELEDEHRVLKEKYDTLVATFNTQEASHHHATHGWRERVAAADAEQAALSETVQALRGELATLETRFAGLQDECGRLEREAVAAKAEAATLRGNAQMNAQLRDYCAELLDHCQTLQEEEAEGGAGDEEHGKQEVRPAQSTRPADATRDASHNNNNNNNFAATAEVAGEELDGTAADSHAAAATVATDVPQEPVETAALPVRPTAGESAEAASAAAGVGEDSAGEAATAGEDAKHGAGGLPPAMQHVDPASPVYGDLCRQLDFDAVSPPGSAGPAATAVLRRDDGGADADADAHPADDETWGATDASQSVVGSPAPARAGGPAAVSAQASPAVEANALPRATPTPPAEHLSAEALAALPPTRPRNRQVPVRPPGRDTKEPDAELLERALKYALVDEE